MVQANHTRTLSQLQAVPAHGARTIARLSERAGTLPRTTSELPERAGAPYLQDLAAAGACRRTVHGASPGCGGGQDSLNGG